MIGDALPTAALDLLPPEQWAEACGPCAQSREGLALAKAQAQKAFALGAVAGLLAGFLVLKLAKG